VPGGWIGRSTDPARPASGDLQGATLSGRHTGFAVVAVLRSERRETSEFVPFREPHGRLADFCFLTRPACD
jgi:hypothetical protein